MADRNEDTPTIREIAELTAHLRRLSNAGQVVDPAERAAFLGDKDALLDRIENANRRADQPHAESSAHVPEQVSGDVESAVLARAMAGGYVMVGPSARTWSVDPATGIPVGPVGEAEHRAVRDLIAQERLDGTEPVWLHCADGGEEIVAAVVPACVEVDDLADLADLDTASLVEDDDGWFPEGYNAAHTASLDELGHVDALPDDPADQLMDEPAGGWHMVSAAQAAQELVGQGIDRDTAHALIRAYLRDTSERVGAPADEWGLDQADIDALAASRQHPASNVEAAEPTTDDMPGAADAVARAHDALTPLIARLEAATHRAGTPVDTADEPAHDVRPDTAARTGEPLGDERSASDDDGEEWSR